MKIFKTRYLLSTNKTKEKTTNTIALVVFYLFQVVALLSTEYGWFDGRQLAFFAIIALTFFLQPCSILMLIAATLPISEIARMGSSSLTLLPFLAALYLLKIVYRNHFLPVKMAIPLLICSFLSLVSELLHWGSFISSLLFLMTWLIPVISVHIKSEINRNIKSLLSVFVISNLVSIAGSSLFDKAGAIITGISTSTFYRAVGFSNSWSFGINLVVAAAFALILYSYMRRGFIVLYVIAGVCLFFAIRTGTFSVFIAMVLVIIYAAKLLYRKSKKYVLLVIPFIFIMCVLAYKQLTNIRGGGFDDNGRYAIWGFYIKELANNWQLLLFGVGGGKIASYAAACGVLTAHNALLEILLEHGILGGIPLLVFILQMLRESFRNKATLYFGLPVLLYMAYTITQGGATSYSLSFYFTIFLCMSLDEKSNKGSLL